MKRDAAEYLLIEDNDYDVEITIFDFEEHGVANIFHIARDGVDALDYLFAESGSLRVVPPTAIFLDLHMPKICGLEFLHKIRSNEQTKNIPVVVLKSSSNPREIAECKRLGVKNFIDKPFEYEKFIAVMKMI